jgi:hypothetical protein
MWMQIIIGAAWLIWLSSGTAGLEKGLTMGALLLLGLGMKNILDTFCKRESAESSNTETGFKAAEPSWSASRNHGYRPGSNWNSSRTDDPLTSPALRGFGRRFADPRA